MSSNRGIGLIAIEERIAILSWLNNNARGKQAMRITKFTTFKEASD